MTPVQALALSAIGAMVVCGIVLRLAGRTGFHDTPRPGRAHKLAMPLGGGLGLVAGFLAGMGPLEGDREMLLGTCVVGLLVVGLVDDLVRGRMGRWVKPAALAAAAAALAVGGLRPGWCADPLLDGLAGALWVTAAAAALAVWDHADGWLALPVAAAALVCGWPAGHVPLIALAGACLGFAVWNAPLPRARMFAGDAGALPVGFLAASLPLWEGAPTAGGWGILVIWALPVADAVRCSVRRMRAGGHPLDGDIGHAGHLGMARWGVWPALLGATGACAASAWLASAG